MSIASAHPVRIEGTLDPELSRWLWLVKWLLAIPHFIVLFFLVIAFVLLTIVAFFAILFTETLHPRGSNPDGERGLAAASRRANDAC